MNGITNIGAIKGVLQDAANPDKQTSATGFQDALKEAVSAGRAGSENNTTMGINRVTDVQALAANTSISMMQKTEHLLDLMDYYAKGLANPEKTLKDLEPIAVSMKENANELFQQARSDGGDNSLNQIARATAFTANVEYAKFSRGDYIG